MVAARRRQYGSLRQGEIDYDRRCQRLRFFGETGTISTHGHGTHYRRETYENQGHQMSRSTEIVLSNAVEMEKGRKPSSLIALGAERRLFPPALPR